MNAVDRQDSGGMERTRSRPNVGGDATRAALIAAAERLFAERGIEGVSLREIGAAAGKRNSNVTQYHFGDRDSLVRAIVQSRARSLNERRLAILTEVGDAPEGLARALVEPLADHLAGDDHYLGFLFQLLVASGGRLPFAPDLDAESTSSFRRVARQLREALPGVDEQVVRARVELAVDFVVMALASRAAAERRQVRGLLPRRTFVDEVVRATAGVLSNP